MSSLPIRERFDKDRNPCPLCAGGNPCCRAPSGLYLCHKTHDSVPGFVCVGHSESAIDCSMFITEEEHQQRADNRRSLNRRETRSPEEVAIALEAERQRTLAKKAELTADLLSRCTADPEPLNWLRKLADRLLGPDTPTYGLVAIGTMLSLCGLPHPTQPDNLAACTVTPLRDETDRPVGLRQRYDWPDANGKDKLSPKGTAAALAFAPDRDWYAVRQLVIVEGESDAAACETAGIAVIAKPSNKGGHNYLERFIRDRIHPDCQLVVASENDKKPNGTHPGLDGARATTQMIAKQLGRKSYIWTPPAEDGKDIRDHLKAEAARNGGGESGWRMAGEALATLWRAGEGLRLVSPMPHLREFVLLKEDNGQDELSQRSEAGPVLELPPILMPPALCQVYDQEDRRTCPRCTCPVLQHKSRKHDLRMPVKGCGKWNCEVCETTQRARRAFHMQQVIMPTLTVAFVGLLPGSRVVNDDAHKLKAEYTTVKQAGYLEQFVISDKPLPGLTQAASLADALNAYCLALLNTPHAPRPGTNVLAPCRASRGWDLSDDEPKSGQWDVIGTVDGKDLPSTEAALRGQVDRGEIGGEKRPHGRGAVWDIWLPPWWSAERVLAYAQFGMRDAQFEPSQSPGEAIVSPWDNQPSSTPEEVTCWT